MVEKISSVLLRIVLVGHYISIHPGAIHNSVWQFGTHATTKNGTHLIMLLLKCNCVQPEPVIIYHCIII